MLRSWISFLSGDRRLARLQAASGLVFAAFLALHLLNLAATLLGAGHYDRLQGLGRVVYQHPLVEFGVLFVSLGIHVVVGIVRIRRRPRRGRAKLPRRTRVHRWSGYVLLVFVFGHILATRLPDWLYGVPLGERGLSFTLSWLWLFYPYYAGLAVAGLVHGGVGVVLALQILKAPVGKISVRSRPLWSALAVASVVLVAGVAALGGAFHEIPNPNDNDYARLYAEWFDVDPGGL